MPETASFTAITRLAILNLLRDRKVWWLSIPAGLFIAASALSASKASSLIADKESAELISWIQGGSGDIFLIFLGISLLSMLAEAPVRGAAILLLQHVHLKEKSEQSPQLGKRDIFRGMKRAFFFEISFFAIVLSLAFILIVPSLFAWKFNQSAFIPVLEIGLILLLGISFYLYFIKELALFYSLLGKTGFRESVNLSFRVFQRYSFLTVLFFIYLSMLTFIATSCIDILTRIIPLLFGGAENDILLFIATVPLFGFYFLFDQALRLAYFRSIAASPKERAKKVPVAREMDRATGTTNV